MKGEDKIKDLFSEKLRDFEVDVNPTLWNSIAQELNGAAATTGLSALSKGIIAAVSVTAIVTTAVLLLSSPEEINKPTDPSIVKKEKKVEENTVIKNDQTSLIDKPEFEQDLLIEEESSEKVDNSNRINENKEEEKVQEEIIAETELYQNIEKNNDVDRTENSEKKEEERLLNEPKVVEEPVIVTKEPIAPEAKYFIERLPNIFSPNNDGQHDVFFINSEGLSDFSLVVLDRNNKIVFQTNDPDFKWTGINLRGYEVPSGNYVYFLTARDVHGIAVNKYSSLTISR